MKGKTKGGEEGRRRGDVGRRKGGAGEEKRRGGGGREWEIKEVTNKWRSK